VVSSVVSSFKFTSDLDVAVGFRIAMQICNSNEYTLLMGIKGKIYGIITEELNKS